MKRITFLTPHTHTHTHTHTHPPTHTHTHTHTRTHTRRFKPLSDDSSEPTDRALVSAAAALLGVADDALVLALVKREMKVGAETMVKDVSAEKASEARDALARGVYDRMFGWLIEKVTGGACVRRREPRHGAPMLRHGSAGRVAQVNSAIDVGGSTRSYICILDIFGFENFDVNGFERLAAQARSHAHART